MTPFNGCDELHSGRPFLTCMIHVTSNERVSTTELYERAMAEVGDFNSKPEHSHNLGIMRAIPTMDGVSKLFHLYTDDLSFLQKSIVMEDNKKMVG